LPGDIQSRVVLALPATLPAGNYSLQTAITDAQEHRESSLLTKGKPPMAGIRWPLLLSGKFLETCSG
jgi:hypothetical protein